MQLKSDLFGTITRAGPVVRRDTRPARWWIRWLARRLATREARALATLAGMPGVPTLLSFRGGVLERTWIEGEPMHRCRPHEPGYFRAAAHMLRRLHRAGVAHNDLAKEPNWLVTPAQEPALVDFQLASVSRHRGRWFRTQAREDIRHILKHKRTYCASHLTNRERRILATPAITSRVWRVTGKKLYLLITRRMLGWRDREGAGDRM